MSIKKIYEVSCDECGCACHYTEQPQLSARQDGWIITSDKKHFDSKECYLKYRFKEDKK